MQIVRIGRQDEHIMSAGIDVGTSTTKLIICKLILGNMAGYSHVPRIEITGKELIYKSPIHRTPLLSETLIDIEAVMEIVTREYGRAGIRPQDIQTGAVIITGETATKTNAEQMVHLLSNQAGEFLVAAAGADLEGIIAAKGSGAFQHSITTGRTVANIDIGGGTANIAVFESGQFRGTCTLHIGGRLIEFNHNAIISISAPVRRLINENGWSITAGQPIDEQLIRQVCRAMSRTLSSVLMGQVNTEGRALLLGHPPDWKVKIDDIMFSGGVSNGIYPITGHEETALQETYQDIGALLSQSLLECRELQQWTWIPPSETVRATVLGAGMQTTELSGATIQVESTRLPAKNVPVYEVNLEHELMNAQYKIQHAVSQAIQIFDPNREGNNFALYLRQLPQLSFHEVLHLATWLVESFKLQPNQAEPMIIVIDKDFAKVLGQTIQAMDPVRDLICIDQIRVDHGDYLDIGNKLKSEVVPVIVKTLAF